MEGYAICTSASFDLKALQERFQGRFKTEKFRDVVHIQSDKGDIFFFSYGAYVSWGCPRHYLLDQIRNFESGSLENIEEDDFSYDLGEKPLCRNNFIALPDDSVTTKLAFSHGLAQSVKLSGFESTIRNLFKKNRHLPEDLAKDGKIPLSRKEIRKRIGMLFLERSSINMHVLDTPEFFWEHPEHEGIYQITAAELELQTRVRAVNQQLAVIHDLFEMLSNELNHQHSSRLEWAIILLIVLEVVLVIFVDILKWK